MSRQIKNKAELRAMLRAEQAKFSECEGACFGDVFWHAADGRWLQLESVDHGRRQ